MKSQNTLLKKVVLLSISIFIPIILFSAFALVRSNQKLKSQILSSIDSNNNSYVTQLDNTINNIYLNDFNLIRKSNFAKFPNVFSTLSIYDKSMSINSMREQLSDLCITTSLVESAHVYFNDLGIIVSSSGYHPRYSSRLPKEQLDALEKLDNEKKRLHHYYDPLSDQWKLALYNSGKGLSKYSSTIVLSPQELKKYLVSNMSYTDEHYFFTAGDSFILSDFDLGLRNDILFLSNHLSEKYSDTTYTRITLEGRDYYVFFYNLCGNSAKYMRFIPANDLLKNTQTTLFLILCFFLFIAISCILFFIGIYHLVHRPLVQLTNAFEEVENGNFKAQITDFQNEDFAYLFQEFNDMTLKLDKLIERDYNQKMLLQKAELKQLQAQINPHFLYNSFFMLQRMIKMELMEDSQELANALGVYFRYLTRNSREQVTLSEEYEHAKTYSYIQGLRFAGRIQINFEELPQDFANIPVPKLIMQPLLENAFNYGLRNKLKDGFLNIRFSSVDDALTVIVEENGEELTDEVLQTLSEKLETVKNDSSSYEMTGLLNIQRRLNIFSDYNYSIHVSRSQIGGLCVAITLKTNTNTEVN